ncbi:P-II family nitrogen regulator [Pyruvatibacter mobilis]|uniref:P-II family nitrogen regulator n=1 Tax=Pyruvatibacter mobilis TaxID=1712261 RepID=UPI003BA9C91C
MAVSTTLCKRLELIIARPHLQIFAKLFETAGVTGWTAMKTAGGTGTSGMWREDQLTGADEHVVVLAIMDAAAAEAVLEEISTLFARYPGVVSVTDAQVLRPERFSGQPRKADQ